MKRLLYNPADFEPVARIALQFPGTHEDTSHEGTPSVKVGKKLMCRLHDNGLWIPIQLDFPIRDQYLDSHPEIFILPEHFKKWPYIAMVIHQYDVKLLREVLELSWRGLASKTLIKKFDETA